MLLLTVNAIIGHMHSRGSQKAVELLKKKLAIKAKVLRDGKWVMKEAKEIVPGDIIVVGLGDIVPADAKILSGELSVDQSALTGESLPVDDTSFRRHLFKLHSEAGRSQMCRSQYWSQYILW